ncbi:MAG: DUF4249 domain-containing protein [Lacibacter sp.]
MKKFAAISVWVLLLSCERTIEIDVPEQTSRLVINGQWPQNRFFSVHISKSFTITDSFSYNTSSIRYLVKNAFVLVKENGTPVDTLKWDSLNIRYSSTKKRTKLDSSYSIEVSAPGFVTATASSSMPAFIRPSKIAIKKDVRTSSDDQLQSEVAVTFTDFPSSNYYLFRFRTIKGGISCINTNDNVVEKTGLSDPFDTDHCFSGNKLLVKDETFNGKEKTIVFYVNTADLLPAVDPVSRRTVRPWLEMMHIHKDYFNYIKSVNIYDDVNGNPLAEPVNVVSNVRNGYGFFSVYTLSVDTLRL